MNNIRIVLLRSQIQLHHCFNTCKGLCNVSVTWGFAFWLSSADSSNDAEPLHKPQASVQSVPLVGTLLESSGSFSACLKCTYHACDVLKLICQYDNAVHASMQRKWGNTARCLPMHLMELKFLAWGHAATARQGTSESKAPAQMECDDSDSSDDLAMRPVSRHRLPPAINAPIGFLFYLSCS